jgi:hypothetical protein
MDDDVILGMYVLLDREGKHFEGEGRNEIVSQ